MSQISCSISFPGLDIIIPSLLRLWDSACQCSSLFSFPAEAQRDQVWLSAVIIHLLSLCSLPCCSVTSEPNRLPAHLTSLSSDSFWTLNFSFFLSPLILTPHHQLSPCLGFLHAFPKNQGMLLGTFKTTLKITSHMSWRFSSWFPKNSLHLPKLSSVSSSVQIASRKRIHQGFILVVSELRELSCKAWLKEDLCVCLTHKQMGTSLPPKGLHGWCAFYKNREWEILPQLQNLLGSQFQTSLHDRVLQKPSRQHIYLPLDLCIPLYGFL